MDVRDFEFWFREAQRKEIYEQMQALRISRMGMAEGDVVKEEFNRLNSILEMIDGPKPKRYPKTWIEAMGNRKGN